MFKIDKTLIDNMNMNRACIVIKHEETIVEKPMPPEELELEDEDDEQELLKKAKEKAQQHLQNAQNEAQSIICGAKEQAEELKETAREEGLAQGLSEAEERFKALIAARTEELDSAFKEIDEYKDRLYQALESHVLELSIEIAQKIINIELERNDEAFVELVKNAVNNLKKADQFMLTVSRADYDRFFKNDIDWLLESNGADCEVISDPHMEQGDCVLETNNEILDASVSVQLGNIKRYLNEQVE